MCQGRLFWDFAGFPRPTGHGMEQDPAAPDFLRAKAGLLYEQTFRTTLDVGLTEV